MSGSVRLSWRTGTSAECGDAGVVVSGLGARLTMRTAPAVLSALGRLAAPGADEESLAQSVLDAGGQAALTRWYYVIEELSRRGLLARTACIGELRLATLEAISPPFESKPAIVERERVVALSRFAYLRRERGEAVLECPTGRVRVTLHDCRSAALIAALSRPTTSAELAEQPTGLPVEAVVALMNLLAQAEMLRSVNPTGATAEEEDPALQSWEFHDLLFHSRSRKGRSDAPFGGTYRFADRFPAPPALESAGDGEAFELYRPDPEELQRDDPPLALVQEQRCSIRNYGRRPIAARQLGEFLFRVARVKSCREIEAETTYGPIGIPIAVRPYPAGGGLYELEVYAAINASDDLPGGLYRYDGLGHRLVRRSGRTLEFEQLLADAGASAAVPKGNLQVLLILAARFRRIAWKYSSIAYALVLKHVGVLYQTMYLAATAMDLAPCALGGGDADLFARAAGTDYCIETSVGEFLLGSRP